MSGLSADWRRFVKINRSVLLKDPPLEQSSKVYNFLNEKVQVNLQSYRKFTASSMLLDAIFGENFENVSEYIVYQTKRRVFIYLSSYRILQKIFDINNYSAVKAVKDNITYLSCGKVNIQINKKNILGYVLDEDKDNFKVLLANNMGVSVQKPLLVTNVADNGKIISVSYDYGDISNIKPDTYVITYFWPTRIKILKNAIENIHILMNKVALDDYIEVVDQCSS